MALTGKTGADAVFKALKRICLVIAHYGPKLQAVITSAEGADVITTDQATAARALVSSAQGACDAFALIAKYSGFNTDPS